MNINMPKRHVRLVDSKDANKGGLSMSVFDNSSKELIKLSKAAKSALTVDKFHFQYNEEPYGSFESDFEKEIEEEMAKIEAYASEEGLDISSQASKVSQSPFYFGEIAVHSAPPGEDYVDTYIGKIALTTASVNEDEIRPLRFNMEVKTRLNNGENIDEIIKSSFSHFKVVKF